MEDGEQGKKDGEPLVSTGEMLPQGGGLEERREVPDAGCFGGKLSGAADG